MEEMLVDCCITFLKIIEKLKDSGQISQEEYDSQIKLKVEFLSRFGL